MPSIVYGLIGGILIGLSAIALMAFNGRIAGISGVLGGMADARGEEFSWRLSMIGGLLVGGAIMFMVLPGSFAAPPEDLSIGAIVLAGLLVGFGTRLGSGCTSGHGICGLSRLSSRSFVAVLTFMATAAITVAIVH
jgi:uncharacterized membrane protein YedE/YeeE